MLRKVEYSSTPVEGEEIHPVSYRGCNHAKGEEHKELPGILWEDVLL
jgi:hypothetical protein